MSGISYDTLVTLVIIRDYTEVDSNVFTDRLNVENFILNAQQRINVRFTYGF
jgi:hypothetical protein